MYNRPKEFYNQTPSHNTGHRTGHARDWRALAHGRKNFTTKLKSRSRPKERKGRAVPPTGNYATRISKKIHFTRMGRRRATSQPLQVATSQPPTVLIISLNCSAYSYCPFVFEQLAPLLQVPSSDWSRDGWLTKVCTQAQAHASARAEGGLSRPLKPEDLCSVRTSIPLFNRLCAGFDTHYLSGGLTEQNLRCGRKYGLTDRQKAYSPARGCPHKNIHSSLTRRDNEESTEDLSLV